MAVALGRRPGISDDGTIVVFYGNLAETNGGPGQIETGTLGPGIFVSIDDGGAARRIVRVAGNPAELG